MIREQDKKPGPDDGVMMISRVTVAASINAKRRSVAAEHYRAARLAKKGICPVVETVDAKLAKSLSLDNETAGAGYWARQAAQPIKRSNAAEAVPYSKRHREGVDGWGRVTDYAASAVAGAGISPGL